MIIVMMTSGLGNQMYQYSMYKLLSLTYPDTEIKADITRFRLYSAHQGFELKRIFEHPGSPFHLEKLTSGPKQMKDIRIVQLPDGKIAVASRPQGASMEKYGCIAKIGFTVVDSLNDLTAEAIENAPYLEKLFCDDEWGGANQLMVLKNGKIGVIGHKAYRTYEADGQRLHYYGIAFAVDPQTRRVTQNTMIISGDCFPTVEGKRKDLTDITFTAGIRRLGGGKAEVYTGLNDTHVGYAVIPDPFDRYEE